MLLPLPAPPAIVPPNLPPVLPTIATATVDVDSETAIAFRPILSPETAAQPQFSAPRLAQAVIPNGDGTGTVVTPDGNHLDITGGQLSGDGANLFHSFQEFGLTAEQVANFIASPEIQNILSGVNGGSPSIINGLLQVSDSSTNLYLINPAGIIFGPTGAIDLTGSFTATTANQVGFGDAWFDVQNPTGYEALTGTPSGFAFTNDSSGTVLNLGDLTVDAGESITLLGSDVINLGTITAPEGTIMLAAVPGENLVRISQENQLLSLEIAPPLTETGQLSLNPLALPELLTGNSSTNTDLTVVQAADGTVRLESATAGATVELGSVIASGEISTAGGQGGQIYLLGQQVSLLDAQVNASGQFGGGDIRIGGDFQGQGTLPNAQFSLVDGGSTLQADSLATGDGGSIVVWADDTTRFSGDASVRGGETGGNGGWVEVSGFNLLEFSGEVDASAPLGTIGTLLLDPTNIEIVAAGGETSDLSTVDEFSDADQGMDDTTQINVAAINSAAAKVILQATNNITFSTDVALVTDLEAIALNDIFLNSNLSSDDGVITLQADKNIQLNGIIDTNEDVTITADADDNGVGSVFSDVGTAILSDGGTVDISGAGLQLGFIITTDDVPGTVNLESSENITFEAIDTSASGPDAGAGVNILANGTVQGFAAGITIDTQGGIVGPSGTVTIQHDGGPTNTPFTIGDASVNGTAGAITADSIVTTGTFDVQSTGGTDNPSPGITIESINTPPTLAASQSLATAVDQPLTFTLADLDSTVADANSDVTTLEIVSIPAGTLLSNGLPVQPGDAIAPTDTLQYTPPPGSIGGLTAFTLRASDGVAASEPVAVAVTITEAPLPPEPPETPDVLDPTLGINPLPPTDLLPTEQTLIQGMPLAQSTQLEELSVLGMVLPEPGFLIVAAIAISVDEDGIFPPNTANAPAANVPSLDVAAAPNVSEGQPEGGLGPDFGQAQEPGGGENGGGGNGSDDGDGGNGGEGGGEEGGEEEQATLDPEPTEDTSDADSGSPLLTNETEPSPAATDDGTDTSSGDTASEDVAALPADDDAATSTRNDEANAGLRNCQETVEAIDNAAASDRTASLYAALIDCYEANLTTATEQEDTRWIAYSLNNLAISHAVIGDYSTALDLYQQQLEQAQALNDPTQIGIALGGLGATYAALGDYATAIDFYEQSLRTLPLETAPQWKALVYRNLGNAYFADEDYENAAQQQLTSLDISRGAGDTYGEMQAYGNLASTRAIQGQFAAAIALHEQGLAIAKTLNNDLEAAQLLLGLGTTYAYQQNYEAAYRTSQAALAIARRLGASLGEGIALTNVGNALLYLERLTEAEQVLFDAVAVWENVRAGLGTSDAFKVSIFETQLIAYRNLQEVLVAQGKTDTALEISERGRARAFVELLARGQGRATAAESVPPPNLVQMQQIAAAQNATLVEYAIIRDQFAEPPHSASVQNPVEPQDAQLYIWVVSPSGTTDFRQVDLRDLSGTTAVADLVVETRLALTGRDSTLIAADRGIGVVAAPRDRPLQPGDRVRREGDLPDIPPYEVVSVSPDGQTVTVSHPDFVLPDPNLSVSELSRVETSGAIALPPLQQLHDLLIAPIANLLPSNPDDLVIFVPQEQLFLTPFAALQDAQGTYVIEQHTIAIAPSIQTLALTNTGAARSTATNALIVGNPSPMPEAFAPLPNAELEANTVADLLSTDALVRGAATEADVKASLASADIIHLATHGRFDGSQPLQGAIALAPDAQNDGFLTAAEILELLLQARLTILSACDTGRGRITGDGVVGLSRSFMAAGVPQVVVSLWQVPDAPTAELMIDFHEARLQGDRPPKALRQAMLASLETYSDPAVWSAFTQVGNLE